MSKTNQEKLDEVQSAITAVLTGGQDVTYNGRRITMADYNTLLNEERRLERVIDRETNGGIRVRRGTPE